MAETIGLRAVLDVSNFKKGLGVYTAGIAKMNKETSGFTATANKQFVSLGKGVAKFGATAATAVAGVAALGTAIGAAFVGSSIKQAADLDEQIAQIAATMGRTKDEVQDLKQLILDLSVDPNLKVSATEAADAVELLARNGLEMEEILGGAARSTVALANATKADFGTAADIATDVMAQFNRTASEMESVIDGITGVTTNSKFSIDDYALAIGQAGGIAAAFGVTLEDFNTVLAATSSSFKSGSDAGTSFKTLLTRLSNPTNDMVTAMNKYGISLFDAEGNMRSMAEIAGQLNTVFNGTVTVTETVGGATSKMTAAAERAQGKLVKLNNTISEQEQELQLLQDEYGAIVFHYGETSLRARNMQLRINKLNNSLSENQETLTGYQAAISAVENAQAETITTTQKLTEAQKAELAAVIGGADAARTVLALAELEEEQFRDLSAEINANGQAFAAAATRVDSLKGAMEIFQSIVSGIQIQIGDKFLPLLQQMTKNFADLAARNGPIIVDFFGRVADRIETIIGVLQGFGGLGTQGIVQALGLTPQTVELVDKFIASAQNIGIVLQNTLGSLTAGGVIDAINQGIIFLNQNFDALAGALAGIGVVLAGGVFAAIVAGVLSLLTPINLIIAGAALLGAAWAANWFGIRDAVLSAWSTIQPVLQQLWDWLQINIPIAIQVVSDFWTNTLLPALQQVGDFINTNIIPILLDVWDWLQVAIPAALQTASDHWTNVLLPAITDVWAFIQNSVIPLLESLNEVFNAVAAKAIEAYAGLWQNVLLPALEDVWVFIQNSIIPVFESIGQTIAETLEPVLENLSENLLPKVESGFDGISHTIANATEFFNDLASSIRDFELPAVLTPGSPTPFELGLQGIANVLSGPLGGAFAVFASSLNQLNLTGFIDGLMSVTEATTLVKIQFDAYVLSVTNFTVITLPLLQETFLLTTTMMIEQLVLVLQTGVMPLDLAFVMMTTVTLPNLQNTATIVAAAIIASFIPVQELINAIIAAVNTLSMAFNTLGTTSTTTGQKIEKGMSRAKNKIEELINIVKKAVKEFERLEAAAKRAAEAARSAGSASGAAGGLGFAKGIGFQAGTPSNTGGALGLGFRIPSGFPNDSFGPFFAQSGEEMLITPRGTSIEDLVVSRLAGLLNGSLVQGGSVTNNYYNFDMTVNTGASPQGVIRQFEVMRGLIGD